MGEGARVNVLSADTHSVNPSDPARRDPANLLIHVGLHKTGTTWLQDRVFVNNKLGFDSPWGPMASPAVAEFMLVDPLSFDAKATLARLGPDVDASRAKGYIPVLSHEGLSSRPVRGTYYAPTVAGRLHEVFPNARIVIGIREQKGMILSLYRQFVRNGGVYSLKQFIGTGNEPAAGRPCAGSSFSTTTVSSAAIRNCSARTTSSSSRWNSCAMTSRGICGDCSTSPAARARPKTSAKQVSPTPAGADRRSRSSASSAGSLSATRSAPSSPGASATRSGSATSSTRSFQSLATPRSRNHGRRTSKSARRVATTRATPSWRA